jgi:hypothetical protein
MINDTAVPQRAVLTALQAVPPNSLQMKTSICVLDGIGLVTAFLFQKAFLGERVDFCFV